VITVSALADTDGLPGGLGGKRCFSWGSYDSDDTFADFSNYGSDVDLIAPGKCIWSTVPGGGYKYMSGTSMAAPHVTGAVALLKASRPYLTPAEVKEALQYLGTLNWKVTSDPDSKHEKLLDVSKIGPRGDFTLDVGLGGTLSEDGGTANYSVGLTRSATMFERITFHADGLPPGVRATFNPPSTYGFNGTSTTMRLLVAAGVPAGSYEFQVVGAEHGIGASTTTTLTIRTEVPTSRGAIDSTPFDTNR
jgi:subtilisin family serine protease